MEARKRPKRLVGFSFLVGFFPLISTFHAGWLELQEGDYLFSRPKVWAHQRENTGVRAAAQDVLKVFVMGRYDLLRRCNLHLCDTECIRKQ